MEGKLTIVSDAERLSVTRTASDVNRSIAQQHFNNLWLQLVFRVSMS
jgi:hypothetical protein